MINAYNRARMAKKAAGSVKKNITITVSQARFIEEDSLNLSHFVQKKLDERMKEKRSVKKDGEKADE